ncbi:MAG TPA: TaqI-like C-terminal specificity domain-containing protein, partial [Candidatus Lokiarchaeia archaeon]|nr:TaqI-like C-terminal specificity domain-containing protein [Candidatus Lokiarchaeia archaeon]
HSIEEAGDLNFLNARDFPDMKRGEEEKGLKRVKASLKNIGENNPNACGFLAARNDFASFALRPQKFFDLSAVQLQKERRFYQAGSKLLIKHNSIIPEAAFTRAPMCFTAAVYSLLCSDENILLYLCGVLNSTLMRFYCIFGINNQSAVTMNLNQYMIRHLPVVPYAEAGSRAVRIIAIVEELSGETETFEAKLAALREKLFADLDREVFSLYQLEEQADLIARKVAGALDMFRKRKKSMA